MSKRQNNNNSTKKENTKEKCYSDLVEDLFQAIEQGNLEKVAELITIKKVGVNQPNPKMIAVRPFHPLHEAIFWGHAQIAMLLLKSGANANRNCGHFQTNPMKIAIKARDKELVNLLLDHGSAMANCDLQQLIPDNYWSDVVLKVIDLQKKQSSTVNNWANLQVAVENEKWIIVERLMQANADINYMRKPSEHLIYRATMRANGPVRRLLDLRALPESFGEQPLILAIQNNNQDHINLLVECAPISFGSVFAAVKSKQEDLAISLISRKQFSTENLSSVNEIGLKEAVQNGMYRALLAILKVIGSEAAKYQSQLDTSLIFAVHQRLLAFIEPLLHHKANPNTLTYDQQSPLSIAIQNNFTEAQALLKANGGSLALFTFSEQMKFDRFDLCWLMLQDPQCKNIPLGSVSWSYRVQTPLELALKAGREDIATELIRRGEYVTEGFPLKEAVAKNFPDLVQSLISAKASLNPVDDLFHPLFFVRYSKEDKERLKVLLQARTLCPNSPLYKDKFPLDMFKLIAQRFYPTRTLRLLLEHKADVNVRSNNSYPLDRMASSPQLVALMLKNNALFSADILKNALDDGLKDLDTIKLLVERNASVNPRNGFFSLLKPAVQNRNLEMVRLLIELKAEISTETAWQHPLIIALQMQNFEIAEELVKHDKSLSRKSGDSVLSWHLEWENISLPVVQFLLEKKGNVNAEGELSTSSLHQAIFRAPTEEAPRLLLEAKANPYTASCNASVGLAISRKFTELAKTLVEMNVSVNATKNDIVPLHQAAQNGDCDMIRFLVAKKADVNFSEQITKDSALTRAIKHCPPEDKVAVCRLLVELGCSVNLCGALEVAAKNCEQQVFKLLLEHNALLPLTSDALRFAISAKDNVFIELLFDISPESSEWDTVSHALRCQNEALAKKITQRILQKNSTETKRLNKHVITALAEGNAKDYLQFLIEAKLPLETCVDSAWNSYPLMIAIQAGATEIAHILIKNGISINQSVSLYRGAHVVPILEHGHLFLLKALVDQGLDLSRLSRKDCNFVFKKTRDQNPETLSLLKQASLPLLN